MTPVVENGEWTNWMNVERRREIVFTDELQTFPCPVRVKSRLHDTRLYFPLRFQVVLAAHFTNEHKGMNE